MAAAMVSGRSTLIGAEPTTAGTVIMNTISSTNTTSTSGTTLMSERVEYSSSPNDEDAAMARFPYCRAAGWAAGAPAGRRSYLMLANTWCASESVCEVACRTLR